MRYRNYIFDFDGTISNSKSFSIKTFIKIYKGKLISKYENISSLEPDGVWEELKNISLRDLRKRFNISLISMLKIAKKIQEEEYKFILQNNKETVLKEIPFYDGVVEVIKEIKKRGCRIYILSSNETKVVEQLLKLAGYRNLFIEVSGGIKLFGKSSKLEKLIRKYSMKKNETVYIGDEEGDVEASRKVGIDSVAVTWGFSGEEILQRSVPTFLCSDPKQLEEIANGMK